VLHELDGRFIPAARARLREIDVALVVADRRAVAALVDDAVHAFVRMIDVYLDVLVPARARIGRHHVVNADAPLTTRGRAAFADVLPTAWDIASPSLADVHGFDEAGMDALPVDEPEAAVLLTEWDDHLYALGLAPLRRVYLRAAGLLGLADEVFMLTPPELQHALTEAVPGLLITQREEQQARYEALKPPLRIEDGFPAPLLRHARLRGLPIGASVEGIIAQRRDLAALLADPPDPGAVVVLPTLTAQAAVALQSLGVQAVCCEYGGAMSHAALMARELQLSALIGCRGCTALPDGIRARVDTTLGRLLVGDAAD
jgi:phosphohistidine swiveling domain-containing protein